MLKKVAMNPDELEWGVKYIWKVGHIHRVVTVTTFCDGISTDSGVWWFEDDLEGQLYGPIEFEL